MKGLKIKIQALLLCGVLITGLFSSCASDENIDNGNKVNAGDKVLTLTLNTPKATTSGAKTRATNMTANSTEDQINRLTIGIFDAAGTTVRTIQELSPNATPGTTGTFNTASGTSTATLVTNSLASNDQVLVAVNAPSGTFNGCASVTDFEGKAITIDVALATPQSGTVGAAEATDNIPMYGKGTITAPVSPATTYTSSLAVQHQLAKITLNSLAVAFDQNGPYKTATFQPTSFFLINVPSDLAFSTAAWPTTAPTSFFHGWAASTSTTDLKAYLGTGIFSTAYSALKYSALVNENSIQPNSILYTMPNNNVTNNNTKLVIGGEFSSDGHSAATTVYYPVNINWKYDATSKTSGPAEASTTTKAVYPNRNYQCDITIKTKGAPSPTTSIDPEDVTVTVTVSAFKPVSQGTIFE